GKKVVRALGVTGGLGVALAAMGVYLLRASVFVPLPGTVRLPGLQQPATVSFDRWQIPHVQANARRDAFFLQGYLHARERFFQMELTRRAASGRLAELLGEKALTLDVRFRRWGLPEATTRQRSLLSPEVEEVLVAYAAGVNAALSTLPRFRLAPELVLLGGQPEPWRVEDTLGVGLLLQYQLTWAAGEELQRWQELMAFGRERARDLWGWSREQADQWIPDVPPVAPAERPSEPPLPVFSGIGSNNWVVAGTRSVTGLPLLANDPHVGVSNPATWYEIHLRALGLEAAGFSVPGAPGVLIGHNAQLAWGLTMVMLDDQDLFRLTLDETGTRERFAGQWRPLHIAIQSVYVRGERQPRQLVVKRSLHGPVVREASGEVFALAWTALLARSPVECFLRLMTASDVYQGMESFAPCESPALNLLLADRRGNIAWQVTGRVPRRGRGAGRLPAPGEDPAWAWQGFEPFERNPRIVNPPSGFLASANHDPFAEGDFWGEPFPGEFAPAHRLRTIKRRLAERERWDVEGFLQLQADVANPQAQELLRLMRPVLEKLSHPAARALLGWDGHMSAHSREAFLWASFLRHLVWRVGLDEATAAGLSRSPFSGETLLQLLLGQVDAAWWDDSSTEQMEGPLEIIRQALEAAERESAGKTWGEAHRLVFAHPLGKLALVGWLFNLGPMGVGGGGQCLNATGYRTQGHDYAVVSLPSLRFVADLDAWDRSQAVLPLGQSGHPLSAHFKDQLPLWLAGRARPMPFSPQAVEQARVRVTHWVP
ncbi:MAG: penicillin acylase family protein, partial [Thermoanaerobaculum sp.]|nr:penicillin acylase family protein [Thermoanaerobaculum sp.]MDW7968599.1 penicillin acylase family protein [Thermoanaerobaculum sp.]